VSGRENHAPFGRIKEAAMAKRGVVGWLLWDAASYPNGAAIPVDGSACPVDDVYYLRAWG
jgi:hypothetical protein